MVQTEVRPEQNGDRRIFGSNGYELYVSGGQIGVHIAGAYLGPINGSVNVADYYDTWMHLALVRENGTSLVYVNGVPHSFPGNSSAPPTPTSLNISQANGTSLHLLDGARVFTFTGAFNPSDLLYQTTTSTTTSTTTLGTSTTSTTTTSTTTTSSTTTAPAPGVQLGWYVSPGGNWNSSANWGAGGAVPPAGPPTIANNAFIGMASWGGYSKNDNSVVIDTAAACATLYVGFGGNTANNLLTIEPGGSLNMASQLRMPENSGANNRIVQNAGIVETHGDVYISLGDTATYTLNGGSLLSHGGSIYDGFSYAGTLTQAAGTTVDTSTTPGNPAGGGGHFSVGWSPAAGNCVYNFNGGVLLVGGHVYQRVNAGYTSTVTQGEGTEMRVNGDFYGCGFQGPGIWTQNGGTNTITGQFRPGEAGGAGTYNLNNGVLQLNHGNNHLSVGGGGATVNQAGGTVNIPNGFLNVSLNAGGVYNLSGGTLNVATLDRNNGGGIFSFTGGKLSATTINFDLTNAGGTLAPGLANGIGHTTINGTYTVSSASATLQAQLSGTGQGTTYDWLSASGAISLNGNLSVPLVSFTPGGGDSFTIVSGASVIGTFANAPVSGNRYNLGGGSFIVTYNPGSVVLGGYEALAPPLPANTVIQFK